MNKKQLIKAALGLMPKTGAAAPKSPASAYQQVLNPEAGYNKETKEWTYPSAKQWQEAADAGQMFRPAWAEGVREVPAAERQRYPLPAIGKDVFGDKWQYKARRAMEHYYGVSAERPKGAPERTSWAYIPPREYHLANLYSKLTPAQRGAWETSMGRRLVEDTGGIFPPMHWAGKPQQYRPPDMVPYKASKPTLPEAVLSADATVPRELPFRGEVPRRIFGPAMAGHELEHGASELLADAVDRDAKHDQKLVQEWPAVLTESLLPLVTYPGEVPNTPYYEPEVAKGGYNPRLDWMARMAKQHGFKFGVGDALRLYRDDPVARNWFQQWYRTAGEGARPKPRRVSWLGRAVNPETYKLLDRMRARADQAPMQTR